MFKKLKEKITEEVKSSPQRLQQFTQSVSDKLQNSTASSDENFFSIGDDDNSLEPGFSNVSLTSPHQEVPRMRRGSNSSIASDVSFLPRYEASSNMYHLQSDLDVSASEMEDNVSNSSQLGHLSKEQIYSAFQKAQMRYHKYRGRYTDLARHYKDLERENTKMKSVLVDTQDKAIRRVAELKEQCGLEQKAKAHLESALRDEIDERQFKIDTLQTKIELLQNHNTSSPSSNDTTSASDSSENLENLTKYLNDARQEIEHLNAKLQENKANLIVAQSKEKEFKAKVTHLEKEIEKFAEREKENNLTLAQNKMELHNELLSRDAEMLNLRQDNEVLRHSLEAFETKGTSGKIDNLQSQNKKLIEKLEALADKCNAQEGDLLKLRQMEILNGELKQKLGETEVALETVRESAKKSLLELESRVKAKYEAEFEAKMKDIEEEFRRKLEQASSDTGDVQGLQVKLMEVEEKLKRGEEDKGQLQFLYEGKCEKYHALEKNQLELIDECARLRKEKSDLEKKLADEGDKLQVEELRTTIEELHTQLLEHQKSSEEKHSKFQEKLAAFHRQVDEETNARQELKKDMENSLKEKERLEVQLKESQIELRKAVNQSAELERNLQEKAVMENDEFKQFEAKKNKYQTAITALELEVKRFRSLEDELEQTRQNEASLKEELSAQTKTFETEINNLQEQLSKEISQVTHYEVEVSNLKKEVKKLEAELNRLVKIEKELHEAKKVEENLRTELAKLEILKVQLEERTDKIEQLKGVEEELAELKEVEAEKVELLRQKSDELEKLQVQLETSHENHSKILNQVKSDHEEVQNEKRRFEEQLKATKEDLRVTITKLEAETKESCDKTELMNQIKIDYEEAQNEKRRLEEELKASKEELRVTIAKLEAEARESRDKALSGLKSDQEALIRDERRLVEDSKKQIDVLNEELKQSKLTEKELRTSLNNIEAERAAAQEEVEVSKKTIRENEEVLAKLQDDLRKVSSGHEAEKEKLSVELKNHLETQNGVQGFVEEICELIEKSNTSFAQLLSKVCNEKSNNLIKRKVQSNFEENLSFLKEALRHENLSINKLSEWLERRDEENEVRMRCEVEELNRRIEELTKSDEMFLKMRQSYEELQQRNGQIQSDNSYLIEENQSLLSQVEELKLKQIEASPPRATSTLEQELKEMERHVSELTNEKQLLQDEIQELKTAPVQKPSNPDKYLKEIEGLRDKLTQYKSLDQTNRSSIEFYESELDKLRRQNEKITRKLDETLVTLNHCAELSNSTEIEYLRNVLYNYMLGKESLVLARVIAAVCKFDQQQTDTVLAKEQQKQSLLGQLGIL